MAVGLLRAVLKAHLEATWNRSVRELGRSGTWAVYVVTGLALLFGALPLFLAGAALGWFGGLKLHLPGAKALLGGVLTAIPLLGGVVSGILGGTRALTWESYKVYPVGLRPLFAAELLAGLGDPFPFLAGLALLGTFLGFSGARPALAPLMLVVCVASLLGMLLLQHLIGALGAVLVKRLQVLLVVFGMLLWGASVLSALGGRPPKGAAPRVSMDPARLAAAKARVVRVVDLLQWTPAAQSLKGLEEISAGRWAPGLGRQALPLLLLGLLAGASTRVLRWESGSEALKVQAPPGSREKTWSFATPAGGVGRLTWETLTGSHLGRFGFLIPLMTVVILRGPLATFTGSGFWALPSAFAYLALTSGQLQFNQFGLDGHGIKALLLLPVAPEAILKGKLLGLAVYQGCQAALLVLLLAFFLKPGIPEILAGLCLAGCFFLVQVLVGHWTSVWLPRALPRDSLKNNGMPLLLVAISLGTALANSVVFGGTWALCLWLAPGALLPVMAVLFGFCLWLYRVLLPAAAGFLDRHRERLLQALT
ncbi:MAG: hypothetical protein U0P81_09210 [Holophagaceae bacterium]